MSYEEEFFETLKLPLSPVTLRRIFLLMMRLHFSDPANYGGLRPMLGDLRYREENSDLSVELLSVFDPKNTDAAPGVYVGFQPFVFHKTGVNNYVGSSDDTSAQYFNMKCTTGLIVKHTAKTADLSSLLGEASAAFLFGLRPMLMARLCLLQFDIETLSDVKQKEKAPERVFESDLICTLAFNYAMTTNIESHRIKKIAATLNPGVE